MWHVLFWTRAADKAFSAHVHKARLQLDHCPVSQHTFQTETHILLSNRRVPMIYNHVWWASLAYTVWGMICPWRESWLCQLTELVVMHWYWNSWLSLSIKGCNLYSFPDSPRLGALLLSFTWRACKIFLKRFTVIVLKLLELWPEDQ